MLRRLERISRLRLHMTSRPQLPGAIAAARLAQTTGHLTSSNPTSIAPSSFARMASSSAGPSSAASNVEFKQIKNMTCFGAGLMGE